MFPQPPAPHGNHHGYGLMPFSTASGRFKNGDITKSIRSTARSRCGHTVVGVLLVNKISSVPSDELSSRFLVPQCPITHPSLEAVDSSYRWIPRNAISATIVSAGFVPPFPVPTANKIGTTSKREWCGVKYPSRRRLYNERFRCKYGFPDFFCQSDRKVKSCGLSKVPQAKLQSIRDLRRTRQ
jgi:hypothetical protein